MIIYHGSTVLVEKPEIRISDSFLDFGTGFYTTTSEHQAERWAKCAERARISDMFRSTNLILS